MLSFEICQSFDLFSLNLNIFWSLLEGEIVMSGYKSKDLTMESQFLPPGPWVYRQLFFKLWINSWPFNSQDQVHHTGPSLTSFTEHTQTYRKTSVWADIT